eukprot:gb/GECH01009480.1/.p1 GENE.gb/GECH01009480.1/~~gb/GECH01009480.1/.p1  ORF type:complete len:2759 (+),score=783.06 gb/GECH01009480.1/:1-8277(+)
MLDDWTEQPLEGSFDPRWQHTTTKIDSRIVMFGGTGEDEIFNDIAILKPMKGHDEKRRWSVTQPRSLVSFNTTAKKTNHYEKLFSKFTFKLNKKPKPDQNKGRADYNRVVPCPRYGHSSVAFENAKIAVFGGFDGQEHYNDVWIVNTETWQWHKVEIRGDLMPPSRREHSCVVKGSKMIIFGGTDGKNCLDDLWSFDFNTSRWKCLDQTVKAGTYPKARYGHQCVVDNNGNMIMMGGYSDMGIAGKYYDDVWILMTDPYEWKLQKVKIKPLSSFGAAFVGQDCVFIFGGYAYSHYRKDSYILDMNKQVCVTVTLNSQDEVHSRKGHSLLYLPSYDEVLLIGGGSRMRGMFGDVWSLRITDIFTIYNVGNSDGSYLEQTDKKLPAPRDELKKISKLTKAVDNDPENVENYIQRGNEFLKLKLYAQALKDAKKADELNSDSPEAKLLLGKCYLKNDEYISAIHSIKELISLNSKPDPTSFSILSEAYFHLRNFEDAIKYAQEAQTNGRSTLKEFYLIGQSHIGLGEYDTATRVFKQAYSKFPDQQKQIQEMIEDAKSKEEQLEKAKQKRKDAQVCYESNKLSEAIKLLTEAIKMIDTLPELFNLRAKSYTQMSDYKLAIQDAKFLVDLIPHKADGYLRAFDVYVACRRIDKALDFLEKGINRVHNSTEVVRMREAMDDLRDKRKNYDEAKSLAQQGEEFMLQKEYDQALDLISQAIKKDSEFVEYYITRSRLYTTMMLFQNATDDAKVAISKAPHNCNAHVALADSLIPIRNFEEAIESLEAALDCSSETDMNDIKAKLEDAKGLRDRMRSAQVSYKNASDIYDKIKKEEKKIDSTERQNLLNRALNYLDVSVKADPANTSYILLRARVHLALKLFVLTITDCQQIIDIDKNCLEAYKIMSRAQYEHGNAEVALKTIQTCIKVAQEMKDPKQEAEVNASNKDLKTIVEREKKILKFRKQAEEFIAKGNLRKALEQYDAGLQLDNTDYSLFYHKASIEYKLGNYPQAMEHVQRAMALIPNMPHLYVLWCNILLAEKDYKGATDVCEVALSTSPLNTPINLVWRKAQIMYRKQMATKYYEEAEKIVTENNIQAIEKMTKAIEHDRDNPDLRLWRASAFLKESKWRDALNDCDVVLKNNPNAVRALYFKGRAYLGLKDFGNARRTFQKGLELHPKDEKLSAKIEEAHEWEETLLQADDLFKKGLLCLEEDEAEEALSYFDQCIALHPYKMIYFVKITEAKLRLFNFSSALEDANFSMELDPASPQPYIVKSQCFLELRRMNDAIELLEEAVELFPEDDQVDLMLGEVREMQMTSSSAESQYQEAKEAFELGDIESSYYIMSDVVYLDPSNYDYQYLLAQATLKLDQQEDALLKAQRLIKLDKKREEGYALCAEIYELMQQPEQILFMVVSGLEHIPHSEQLETIAQDVLSSELSTDGCNLPQEVEEVEEADYEESTDAIWKEIDAQNKVSDNSSKLAMGEAPDDVAVLNLEDLLSSSEHKELIQDLTEKDHSALATTGENTKKFLNNFTKFAGDLLEHRRNEAFPLLLKALYLSCQEDNSFEELASLGAKAMEIGESDKQIANIKNKNSKNIAQTIFSRRYEWLTNDSHPYYQKSEFKTQDQYEEWKKQEKEDLSRFASKFINSASSNLESIASEAASSPEANIDKKENFNIRFTDIIKALFEYESKQRKEGINHIQSIKTIVKHLSFVYGIGNIFSNIELVESSASYLSSISPSQIYLSLLHLTEYVVSYSGILTRKEKRKLETIIDEHPNIVEPIHNLRTFNSSDHQLSVFISCKNAALMNLIFIKIGSNHSSYISILRKAVEKSVENKYDFFKSKLKEELSNSDGENLNAIGIIKLLDQICHQINNQELRYDLLFPTNVEIPRIVVRKYYRLISDEVILYVQNNPPNGAPQGLFQLGEMILRTTKRLSQHVSLSPFPVQKYFTPYIFAWVEEAYGRFSNWARRSVQLDELKSVSDEEQFSTSVMDTFSALSQGLEFLYKKLVPLYYSSASSSTQSSSDNHKIPTELAQPFAQVLGESIEVYCKELKRVFFDIYKPFQTSDQDQLISWLKSAYAAKEEPSTSGLKRFTMDPKMCIVLNNVTKARQRLNDIIFEMEDSSEKSSLDDSVRKSFQNIKAIQNDLVDALGNKNSFIMKAAVLYLVSRLSSIKIRSTFAGIRNLGKEDNSGGALLTQVEGHLNPLLTYLKYQLNAMEENLSRYSYKSVLQSFFDFLIAEFKTLTSPDTGEPINGVQVKVLLEALKPIEEFFRSDLTPNYIERELSVLRDLLNFSVEPTYSLMYRYNTFDVSAKAEGTETDRELTFRDNIFGYLRNREEDRMAKQFVEAETERLQAERRKMEAEMKALESENKRIQQDMSGIDKEIEQIKDGIGTMESSKEQLEKVIEIDQDRRKKLAEMQRMNTQANQQKFKTQRVEKATESLQDLLSKSSTLTRKARSGSSSSEHSHDRGSKHNLREQQFHEEFSLPSSEILLHTYSCTYENFVHGTLFLSPSYVAFEPFVAMTNKFKIHLSSVDQVKKTKVAFILDNAITILTKTGEKYLFSSFFKRNKALREISEQVFKDVAMSSPASPVAGYKGEMTNFPIEKINAVITMQRIYRKHRNKKRSRETSTEEIDEDKTIGVQIPSKFVKRFGLDINDRLIDRFKCTSYALVSTKMFIFSSSIAFAAVGSLDNRKIKFRELRCIEKVKYARLVDNALKFTLLSGETLVYSGFHKRDVVHHTLEHALENAGIHVKCQNKMLLINGF